MRSIVTRFWKRLWYGRTLRTYQKPRGEDVLGTMLLACLWEWRAVCWRTVLAPLSYQRTIPGGSPVKCRVFYYCWVQRGHTPISPSDLSLPAHSANRKTGTSHFTYFFLSIDFTASQSIQQILNYTRSFEETEIISRGNFQNDENERIYVV